MINLAIWNVPDGLKFCAFYFGGFSGMASPILYSFVNSQLKESYGERGLVISSMMTLGFCSQIWVPLFTFPTVQAPRFPHGYPAVVVFEVAMWSILMLGVWYMARWKLRNPDVESTAPTSIDGSIIGDEEEKDGGSDGSSTPQTPAEVQGVLTLACSRVSR